MKSLITAVLFGISLLEHTTHYMKTKRITGIISHIHYECTSRTLLSCLNTTKKLKSVASFPPMPTGCWPALAVSKSLRRASAGFWNTLSLAGDPQMFLPLGETCNKPFCCGYHYPGSWPNGVSDAVPQLITQATQQTPPKKKLKSKHYSFVDRCADSQAGAFFFFFFFFLEPCRIFSLLVLLLVLALA